MTDWAIWSLILAGFGILSFGFYMGECRKVIEDRRNNRIRMISGADTEWLVVAIILLAFSLALAVISRNTPEKLMERANQIRSSTAEK